MTLTSRAFHHDQLGPFCRDLAALAGKEMVLPMNTGAEAVETAIKVARKWGYEVKGVAPDQAKIIVAEGNFHGRTTTIVSFSTDPVARDDFGPFTPGFGSVPYGDAAALQAAIDETTVAVLLEPIQGEAGVLIPPAGYLPAVRELCTQHNVLFIADEIQSGLGPHRRDVRLRARGCRARRLRAGQGARRRHRAGVGRRGQPRGARRADARRARVDVRRQPAGLRGRARGRRGCWRPASSRSGRRARRAAARAPRGAGRPRGHAVRSRGLWAGVDIDPALMTGREVCERLLARGVLAKDTHGSTIRLAPPIVITADDLDWMADQLEAVLSTLTGHRQACRPGQLFRRPPGGAAGRARRRRGRRAGGR